ncbi:B-cell antigen receptor complex-associated protein alpha chain [Rhinatrema bivittatum]|uniref:B-cell antigen receptor complex-associated protein alpha chain n=1 Tax=Rhinatrema bivittatum TaxID=194408 RepID=UPI001126A7EC|nr:B-cell antigen receptor complex-associated protein alpha chain [Rhinatrema bivittatum]
MERHLADCRLLMCPVFLLLHFTGRLSCNVTVHWVPTSVTYRAGEDATLQCRFNASDKVNVTWKRIQSQGNESRTINITAGEDLGVRITLTQTDRSAMVLIRNVDRNDSGVYVCRVSGKKQSQSSCGTYLRILTQTPEAFLKLEESTKNKIITAEGILLLICAVVPGTILLFRKRAENEKMQELKKHLDEGENLYEGLNLDECSMYEDISRGLQSTYQDVANLKLTDPELEKP